MPPRETLNPAAIQCRYEGSPAVLPQAACAWLATHFGGLLRTVPPPGSSIQPAQPRKVAAEPIARVLARTILDAAGARPVARGSDANHGALESCIDSCVRRNDPVMAHMLWSPKKHWVTGDESAVDLAEVAAIDTLHAIHVAVRAIYPPGMTFQLDVEDIEFEFIEGSAPDLLQARQRYIRGLRRLVDVLGIGDIFRIATISEKAVDANELAGWRRQMTQNYRALAAYWEESEREGIERSQWLPSFHALRDLGWIGSIPAEMRQHYLNRLGSRSSEGDATMVAMVLRNLAGILLHRQNGLASGRSGSGSIKFSFIPPARGAPVELLNGRVDLRFVPRKICSRVSAAGPWSTKGYLRERSDRLVLAVAGWHQARAQGALHAEGWFALTRDGESATVRADYLLE